MHIINAMPSYIISEISETLATRYVTAWAVLNADDWKITYTRPGERNISRA